MHQAKLCCSLYLIDVVKTRMQTNPEKYDKGVLAAASDIIKTEGVGFLLAGLGPTVVGYGLEGALKFGFYETFKMVFAHVTVYKFVNYLLASVIAGAVASVVLVSQ
ncbi:solute carrier family 25 protein [archaeon]|nr:MAG: solute carrier family 25 protein [archaeon]